MEEPRGWQVFFSIMELVDCPMTDQDSYLFEKDDNFRESWRQSALYMIGARPKARFINFSYDEMQKVFSFHVAIGERKFRKTSIQFTKLLGRAREELSNLWISTSADHLVFFNGPWGDAESSEYLSFFSVERLTYFRGHGLPGITGFGDYREAATYDLLYVGIAKSTDSYDRLIRRGHKARTKILSNEPQRFPGARVSEEVVLFMFKFDDMILSKITDGVEYPDSEEILSSRKSAVDAEKAFVRLLNPKYNIQTYNSYPQSRDGLYNDGMESWLYVLRENIAFRAAGLTFQGGRKRNSPLGIGDGYGIYVTKDSAAIVTDPGNPYPSERVISTE